MKNQHICSQDAPTGCLDALAVWMPGCLAAWLPGSGSQDLVSQDLVAKIWWPGSGSQDLVASIWQQESSSWNLVARNW